jgi:uncharacterized YigZ family protein
LSLTEQNLDEADVFWEPEEGARAELKVKRSLFIGCLFPCGTAQGVRLALAQVEGEHRDATHNCWAYRLGPRPEVTHSSDDGEPAGTAGKPILGAVRQSGMVNLMVVVTRYFGGVKLGVRGLMEAYGQAASEVIQRTPRARRLLARPVVVRLPYASIGEVTRLLEGRGDALVWGYGGEAEVAARVRESAAPQVTAALDQLLARKKISAWSWGEKR